MPAARWVVVPLTPEFLASLSDSDLVVLQQDLQPVPDARGHLDQVLAEVKRREGASS
jgi:hypothetical protein